MSHFWQKKLEFLPKKSGKNLEKSWFFLDFDHVEMRTIFELLLRGSVTRARATILVPSWKQGESISATIYGCPGYPGNPYIVGPYKWVLFHFFLRNLCAIFRKKGWKNFLKISAETSAFGKSEAVLGRPRFDPGWTNFLLIVGRHCGPLASLLAAGRHPPNPPKNHRISEKLFFGVDSSGGSGGANCEMLLAYTCSAFWLKKPFHGCATWF